MSQYHALAARIEQFLARLPKAEKGPITNKSLRREMEDLFNSYDAACKNVLTRLRECEAHLLNRRYDEFVQACGGRFNVFDDDRDLRFEGLSEWRDVLVRNGCPFLPSVAPNWVSDLEHWCEHCRSADTYWRQLRKVAVARAPLSAMIFALRQVALKLPDDPDLARDLEEWEVRRHRDIRGETARACQAGDFEALNALYEEVQSDGWRRPVPADLARWVVAQWESLRPQWAQKRLGELSHDLDRIFQEQAALSQRQDAAELDGQIVKLAGEGRKARDGWKECRAVVGADLPQEVADRARPCLEWLKELDEVDRRKQEELDALHNLRSAIRERKALSHVRRVYERSVQLGAKLPSEDEVSYQNYRRWVTRRRVGQLIAIGTTVLSIVVLGGGAIWWLEDYSSRQTEIASAAAELEQFLAQGRIGEANRLAEELQSRRPSVAASPEVRELALKAAQLESDEKRRQGQFEAALKAAEDLAGAEAEPIDPEEVQRTLTRLRDAARQEADHAQVRAVQTRLEKKLGRQLKAFESRVGLLATDETSPEDARLSTAQQLKKELVAFETLAPLGTEITRKVAELKTALGRIEEIIDRQKSERTVDRNLTQAVGNPQNFASLLNDYVQRNPSAERARDFRQVLEAEPTWKGTEAWNQFLADWPKLDRAKLAPAMARTYIDRIEKLAQAHPGFPQHAELRQLTIPHLETISRRRPAGERGIIDGLNEVFSDRLVQRVWLIKDTDGLRYYSPAELRRPSDPAAEVDIEYFTAHDASTQQTRSAVSSVAPAPQSILAQLAVPMLEGMDDSNWEQTHFKLLEAIVAQKDMDPILKVVLLQKTLDCGCAGSYAFAQGFQPFVKLLQTAALDLTVLWMAPEDAEADRVRSQAQLLLGRLPDLGAAGMAAAASLRKFREERFSSVVWIGWLARDTAGRTPWKCAGPAIPATAGTVVTVRKMDQNAAMYRPLGQLVQGRLTVDPAASHLLVEGTPLYFQSAAP